MRRIHSENRASVSSGSILKSIVDRESLPNCFVFFFFFFDSQQRIFQKTKQPSMASARVLLNVRLMKNVKKYCVILPIFGFLVSVEYFLGKFTLWYRKIRRYVLATWHRVNKFCRKKVTYYSPELDLLIVRDTRVRIFEMQRTFFVLA